MYAIRSYYEHEINMARKNKLQSVTFSLKTVEPGNTLFIKTYTMPIKSFFKYLDTALLEKFAKEKMPDFPCCRYFGDRGEVVFEKLIEKRFIAEFNKNFNTYYSSKNSNVIEIVAVSKKPCNENGYDGVKVRHQLKDFIQNNYIMPDVPLKNIAEYFKQNQVIIDEVRKMMR